MKLPSRATFALRRSSATNGCTRSKVNLYVCYCPEGMVHLEICGMHNLFLPAVSFVVGYFPDFVPQKMSDGFK